MRQLFNLRSPQNYGSFAEREYVRHGRTGLIMTRSNCRTDAGRSEKNDVFYFIRRTCGATCRHFLFSSLSSPQPLVRTGEPAPARLHPRHNMEVRVTTVSLVYVGAVESCGSHRLCKVRFPELSLCGRFIEPKGCRSANPFTRALDRTLTTNARHTVRTRSM